MAPRGNRRQRFVAYGTGGFALAVNAMVLFLLPLRAIQLDIDLALIGLLLGAKALTEAVVAVPLGGALDRIGVRSAYLAGTGAAALTLLAYGMVTSFLGLLALQVALGLTRPLAWIAAQHYVSGMRTGANQAYDTGRLSFVANVGQIVGPLLVGVAATGVGVRAAFVVLSLYCAIFFLLGLGLPACPPAAATTASHNYSRGEGARSALRIMSIPQMQVALLLTFARLWIPTAWMSFYPLYLVHETGLSEAAASTVISSMAVIATLMTLFTGKLSRLGRAESVTAAALAIASVGLAISPFLPLLGSSPLIYLSALLVGIGHGVSLPMLIVIVSNAAPEGQRGLAFGVRTTFNQAASTLAPITVAPLVGVAGGVLGFPVAGAISGLAILGAILRKRRSGGKRPRGSDLSLKSSR